MVELAGGPSYRYASASLTGPGLNPWDRTRWSGGSSSGSGIAVAAGLVTYALGSETSGSILTPAAFCGVTGLRPTYGLVSRHGAMPLSWTLDKVGPMCRTAEDCGHGAARHRRRRWRGSRLGRQEFLLRAPVHSRIEGAPRWLRARGFLRVGRSRRAPRLMRKPSTPSARSACRWWRPSFRSFPMVPSSAPSSLPKASVDFRAADSKRQR